MRKILLSLAAASAALISASPAAAQYYPQQRYGYGRMVTVWSAFESRLDNVRRSLGGVRPDRAYGLAAEANRLDRQVRFAARTNASAYEVRELDARITQLERRVSWLSRGYGNRGYDSYDGSYGYRDRRDHTDDGYQGRWNGDGDRANN